MKDLGHIILRNGIKVYPENTEKVKNFQVPKNAKQVKNSLE